jgi:hypothetical protein
VGLKQDKKGGQKGKGKKKGGTKKGSKEPLFCRGRFPLFTASYKEVLKKIETGPALYSMSPA